MTTIEIDDEVFEYLQNKAIPLVDTSNAVLRRLLFGENPSKGNNHSLSIEPNIVPKTDQSKSTDQFIKTVLQSEFQESFKIKSPYRFMFESENYLVYFQNFNKPSQNLWFRITEKPFKRLKDTKNKRSFISLTNPSGSIAYVMPMEDILKEIGVSGWARNYLEVNIDFKNSRWRELDWYIGKYMKKYPS